MSKRQKKEQSKKMFQSPKSKEIYPMEADIPGKKSLKK